MTIDSAPPPTATWRTAAIYIDCPTPHCGGGVETASGSFMIDPLTVPEDARPNALYTCGECGQPFRIPTAALRALGVVQQ